MIAITTRQKSQCFSMLQSGVVYEGESVRSRFNGKNEIALSTDKQDLEISNRFFPLLLSSIIL